MLHTKVFKLAFLGVLALAPTLLLATNKPVKRGAQTALNAKAVNNATPQPRISRRSHGPAVLRAQILLDQHHFSSGQMDGSFGEDMVNAVLGYQKSHDLKATGVIDSATWKSLNTGAAEALVIYTIKPEDVKGPFEPVPNDMMEQSKLTALGYESPQEALGERFHMDPKVLAKLNPGKDLTKEGEEIMAPNVRTDKIAGVTRVSVSKSKRTVSAYGADDKPIAQYPATIGSVHDPLPLGDWKVTIVQQKPMFNYNPDLFWDAKPEDVKAKIAPGPNNPVGVVWIGLSKEHYGIHGTPHPELIGHVESHGCIRLTNWDAEELSHLVRRGTAVSLEN
jgi:lipoprotein-anchoring transpeptidase ErfK/SrfK